MQSVSGMEKFLVFREVEHKVTCRLWRVNDCCSSNLYVIYLILTQKRDIIAKRDSSLVAATRSSGMRLISPTLSVKLLSYQRA